MEKELQSLLDKIVNNESDKDQAWKRAQEIMDLDNLNMVYFMGLYYKFKSASSEEKPIHIFEEEKECAAEVQIAYPTAIAPEKLMKSLPYVEYSSLDDSLKEEAKKATVWIKKMQAGTGTSMVRDSYLEKIHGKKTKIGAKGTDLVVTINGHEKISLAEIQMLQSVKDAEDKKYSKIVLHDIVSSETQESINSIWNKKTFIEPKLSYEEYFQKRERLEHYGKSFQSFIPTIDKAGNVSFNRRAPGGHALFGVDALRAAYIDDLRPNVEQGSSLISSIGNGEDLSSSPDELMVGWMAANKVPVAMVTTTKTNIDLKGGQIAIIDDKQHGTYVSMIEKAQAESSDQLELFERLGLRENDNSAFFNTNMVLINYDVLSPMIKELIEEIGEDEFIKIIAPDLIKNSKKQVDEDGVERTYTQLEGAMGLVFLNLDKFWRKKYKKPIVHFLNVDAINRTKFFSPVKTGFDFFMQFLSDRFELDAASYRLKNHVAGKLPDVTLKNSYYKDVQNTLDSFVGCSIKELESLYVEGIVDFKGQKLTGRVEK